MLGCLRLPHYRVCLSTIYTCGLRLQEWLAALGRALPAGRQWLQRPQVPRSLHLPRLHQQTAHPESRGWPGPNSSAEAADAPPSLTPPQSFVRCPACGRPCARAHSLILKEVNRREQRRCTQTSSPPRGRGRRFPAPVLARAWLPKSGLRQSVTPAGESPGLVSDPPQGRSPRTG